MKHFRDFKLFKEEYSTHSNKLFIDHSVLKFQDNFPFVDTKVIATRFEILFDKYVSEYMVSTSDKRYSKKMKVVYDDSEGFFFMYENETNIENYIFRADDYIIMRNWCFIWKISIEHQQESFPEYVEHIIQKNSVDLEKLTSLMKDFIIETLKEDPHFFKLKDGSYNEDFLSEFNVSPNDIAAVKFGI